jgi:hypothetical protein
MGNLAPVAFDIETSGLDEDAVITVAGFSHDLMNWLALNTDGRHADAAALTEALNQCTDRQTELVVTPDEQRCSELSIRSSMTESTAMRTISPLTGIQGESLALERGDESDVICSKPGDATHLQSPCLSG